MHLPSLPRTAAGDYNFLRLTGAALDLSERGIGGRLAPRGLDAFLYSERGVYRPGETVYLSVLLRDSAARAEGARPLTVKVVRPGGTEVFHATATGDELGGYLFEVPLSPAARPGSWTASAFLDAQGRAIGSTTFQVEDFVPPRIEAALTSDTDWLAPGVATDLRLSGKYLYGPPAADLETKSRVALLVDPRPYPDHADYHFGLVQETFRPRRFDLESARSDQNGEALIRLTVDQLPDSSHPLQAEVTALLLDLGGRPVAARLALPLRSRAVEVGLKPQFKGALGRDAEAVFDLLALDPAGKPVGGRRVTYEWVREIHEYSWYRQSNNWHHRITVHDEVEEAGTLTLDAEGGGTVARRLETGRFRLDLFDAEGTSAASMRFTAGWWYRSTTPDVPDALELSLQAGSLRDGETLRAFVKAPFGGQALVTVVNDRLRARQVIALPPDGAEIALPVAADWGPGAYLMVTAFRPEAGKPSPLPTRALGLAWFAIERANRTLDVEISVPEVVAPRQAVTVPLRVRGRAAGAPLRVTLAAVDEGILQLTGFATPRPQDHFLGQRRLAMDVRDLYGRLIRPLAGQAGRLRSGGDRALENAQGTTLRTVKTVALYHRDIVPDGDGKAEVTLDLPDFNGRLRLMAVAYGRTRVGSGQAALVVRDPLIADLLLPRFLALGDEALATLDLHNLSGMNRDLRVTLAAEGAVALVEADLREISLGDGARHTTRIAIAGRGIGAGRLMLSVRAEGLAPIDREWEIAVRPAQPYVTRRLVRSLQPGESATLTGVMPADLLAETASVNVTVTARPDFNLPDLLQSLDRYPYGCTEQTVSRALPLLYYGDLAETVGQDRDDHDSLRKIDRAIRRTLERQRGDGSFAVWQSFGRAHPWLTAYVFDFLTRAKEAGRPVPPAAYGLTLTWLRRSLENRRVPRYAKAYGYYVLARIGEMKASSLRYFAESQAKRIRTRLGLGQVAAALALVGERERAEELFEQAIDKRRPKHATIQDYGSDLRDGAAIAALLAEVDDGSTRSQRLATALERAFDRRANFNTQEEAWLVLATHALSTGKDTELRIALADGIRLAQDQAYRRRFSPGDLDADFTVENQGQRPIRLITAIRAVPASPLPPSAEGFALTRTFFRPDGSLAAPEAVRQNDRFVVLLEGKAENDREQQALVVDLLPAGFEIENPALGGAAEKAAFAFLPKLSKTAFTAARDDRFVAALDLTRGQSFAVAYLVRAVTPGRYILPGSFVEDMYRPQYHARGALSRITIAVP